MKLGGPQIRSSRRECKTRFFCSPTGSLLIILSMQPASKCLLFPYNTVAITRENFKFIRLRLTAINRSVSLTQANVSYCSIHNIFRTIYAIIHHRRLLWSNGQSSWLQIQRLRFRFPVLPHFLRSSSGSETGSTQPLEDNWGVTWKKSSGSGLENRN
jgi:hypothetical protein